MSDSELEEIKKVITSVKPELEDPERQEVLGKFILSLNLDYNQISGVMALPRFDFNIVEDG